MKRRAGWAIPALLATLGLSAVGAMQLAATFSCSTAARMVPIAVAYPGFNPLKASNAALAARGIPMRPANPNGLAAWTSAMKHFRYMVTAPMCASGPQSVNLGP